MEFSDSLQALQHVQGVQEPSRLEDHLISSRTIALLIDAGLSGDSLKQITAAFESDVEHACNLLRSSVTLSDAGSVTPAALRMRKMREIKRLSEQQEGFEEGVTERNTVTSLSVTSDNNLSSKEVLKKEEIKKERKAVKRNEYPGLFQKFWLLFPTDEGMAKFEAFKAWSKLSEEDHGKAIAAIPAFKVWASKQGPNYRMVHAVRYLSQRRFDGFTETKVSPSAPKKVFLSENSNARSLWTRHDGKESPVAEFRINGRIQRGWYFDSEYPPSSQSRKDAA